MNTEVTNFDIINMINILERYTETRLPQKISYAITRNIMLMQNDYKCYSDELNKILKKYEKYMIKDNNQKIVTNQNGLSIVKDEAINDYNDEICSLLNIKINIKLYTIPISSFNYEENGKYDSLLIKDIIALQSILCEP